VSTRNTAALVNGVRTGCDPGSGSLIADLLAGQDSGPMLRAKRTAEASLFASSFITLSNVRVRTIRDKFFPSWKKPIQKR